MAKVLKNGGLVLLPKEAAFFHKMLALIDLMAFFNKDMTPEEFKSLEDANTEANNRRMCHTYLAKYPSTSKAKRTETGSSVH